MRLPALKEEHKCPCLYQEEGRRVLRGSHQRNEECYGAPLKALVRSDLEKVQEERKMKGMTVRQM